MDGTIKILLVDDEAPLRDGCRRLLALRGYDVITAENGEAALEILARESVNIILLDLKMPVMGGEKVLEITSKRYPQVMVIITTGWLEVDTAVGCMKKGACDFVTKPFEIDSLLLSIKRAVDKIHLEQQANAVSK